MMASLLSRQLRSVISLRYTHNLSPPKPALEVGNQAYDTRCITEQEMNLFGHISGDRNPIHYTGIILSDGTKVSLVHGAFLNAVVSSVIGTKLPGPGTIVVSQNLRFPQPCFVGEEITTTVQITSVRKIVEVAFQCVVGIKSNSPKIVLDGDAKLMLPRKDLKIKDTS